MERTGEGEDNKMNLGIAVGVSTFEELLEYSSIFADKTLFIRDFFINQARTILTTYPRRSGKSMNMRMVQSFFRAEVDKDGNLLPENERKFRKYFVGGEFVPDIGTPKQLNPLKISHDPQMMLHQGEYPVIYMDVKGCTGDTSDKILDSMRTCINKCFLDHEYLLKSDKLSEIERKRLEKYIDLIDCDQLTEKEVHSSLKLLSFLLHKHFNKKAIILIDEYDAPINRAYMDLSDEEFEKAIRLFREIYSSALKNNEYLAKALITGVMRIAKANLFSGLNNLGEYNVTNTEFAPYYGFTQEEVDMLVEHFSIPDYISKEIKSWYNGYRVGVYEIYNVWSVIKCLNKYQHLSSSDYYMSNVELLKMKLLQSYWEESGNVEFIKDLFKWDIIKKKVCELVSGKSITFPLHSSITSRILKF